MKRGIAILLTMLMLLSSVPFAAMPAMAAEKTTHTVLTDFNAENGKEIEGGYELAYKAGNNFAMSSLRGKFFTLESKINIVQGDRASLILGASTNDCSQLMVGTNNFFGLEFKKNQDAVWLKMWQNGGPNARKLGAIFDYVKVVDTTENTFDVKLSYTLEGRLEIWVNGVKAAPVFKQDFDDSYGGGYFGLLAYYGNIQYTDLKLQLAQEIRITCVGDSITEGAGVSDKGADSYPAKMQTLLGDGYAVKNAGVGGRCATPNHDKTYTNHARYLDGVQHDPDIVILMMGTNDANTNLVWNTEDNAASLAAFKTGYQTLIDAYLDIGAEVLLAFPTYSKVATQQSNLETYIMPAIAEMAKTNGLRMVNMNAYIKPHENEWYTDGNHPNAIGYENLGKRFAEEVQKMVSEQTGFTSNVTTWDSANSLWSFGDTGLRGACKSTSNAAFSSAKMIEEGTSFIYEADMMLENRSGALLFGYTDRTKPTDNALAVNIDRTQKFMSIWHFGTANNKGQIKYTLSPSQIAQTSYHIKVEYDGSSKIKLYLDGLLTIETTVANVSKTWTTIPTGYVGVMAHQGVPTFDNLYVYENFVTEKDVKMSDFEILTDGVTITPVFDPDVNIYAMDISSGIDTVTLRPVKGANVSQIYYELKTREYKEVTHAKTVVTDTIVLNKEDFIDNYVNMDLTLVSATGVERVVTFRVHKWFTTEELASQEYRAQFHITPQINFMNDPNGLVYDPTDGYWHAHYQLSPQLSIGMQTWGHVRSKDLVNWEQMPISLQMDDLGRIYSGSAISLTEEEAKNPDIYDGIFADNKAGESRLIAFYTNAGVDGKQRQCTAYSKDHGVTWTKYNGGAPIIDNDKSTSGNKFGDPKVVKIDGDDEHWYMITIGKAQMFASADLIHWEKVQDLKYKDGELYETTDGIIYSECPGMNRVVVEGTDEVKWIYSAADNYYIVGNMVMDEETGYYNWIAESSRIENEDNMQVYNAAEAERFAKYAGMTFYRDGTGKGRTIGISWLMDIKTNQKPYRGHQSLPYEWKLRRDDEGNYKVINYPIEEVEALRSTELYAAEDLTVAEGDRNVFAGVGAAFFDLEAVIDVGDADAFGIHFRKNGDKQLSMRYDAKNEKITLDVTGAKTYYSRGIWTQSARLIDGKLTLRLIVDQGAVEMFAADGESAISCSAFTDNNAGLEMYVEGGAITIDSMKLYDMKSMYSGKAISEAAEPSYYISAPDLAVVGDEIKIDWYSTPAVSVLDLKPVEGIGILDRSEFSATALCMSAGTFELVLIDAEGNELARREITVKEELFNTNIPEWNQYTGIWTVNRNGLACTDSAYANKAFSALTKIPARTAFTYEADMMLEERSGALLFGFSDPANPTADAFAINIDRTQKVFKTWHFKGGTEQRVALSNAQLAQESYHIKVEYNGSDTLTYYLDGVALITKKVSNISSSVTTLPAGYVGVLSHFGKPTFNNVYLYTDGTDVSVNTFDTITVKENSSLDVLIAKLPRTAILTQSDGVKRAEKITWNTATLSTEKGGDFTLNGTVENSALTVSIQVSVLHKWNTEYTVDTSATCGAEGYESIHCSVCTATKDGRAIAATGDHKYTEEVAGTRVDATCMAAGQVTMKCNGCTATEVQTLEINKDNHTANNHIENKKDATCGAKGYTGDTYCECGTLIAAGEETPATGKHSYDKGVVTTEPTTSKEGVKTFTCTVCGTTKTEKIKKLTPAVNFTDVKKGDFFYDAVAWAVELGVTTGTGNGKFSPEEPCTRAQAVTFLWRAAGCPAPKSSNNPFGDVKKSDYYYKAVLWAVENGITKGTSAVAFSPDEPCTRGQIVTFLWRAQSGKKVSVKNPFQDVKASDYYYNAVLWAVKNGVTTGTEANKFSPADTCTRGQIVTFLYRAIAK